MKKIKKINFEVSTFCNHKCTFCSNPDPKTLKSNVSVKDFKIVMDNIYSHLSVDELGLSAKGEPLLNINLAEIINIAKNKYNIDYIYLSTNGALLDNKKLIELLNAGLNSIKFSINGFDVKNYKAIHQKDDFSKVMINLKNAIEVKKRHNFKLFISSVTTIDENIIKKKFEVLLGEDFKYIDGFMHYTPMFTPAIEANVQKELTNYKPCSMLFNEIYIDSNSELTACCFDYFGELRFGDLRYIDFYDAWNSKEFNFLRQMHIKKTLPHNHICYKCLIFNSIS